jgi:hypothetical protein
LVEKIASLKDEILMQAEQEMHDTGQVNPESIDAVKDLAEAEKSCWEAEYYRSVTEAMEDGKMGYDDGMGYRGNRGGMGYGQGQGGSNQGRGYRRGYERESRRGYRGQSRDSMGRYTSRRGYRRMENYGHSDMMAEIRQMMETADPQEREQLKMQLRQMTEM